MYRVDITAEAEAELRSAFRYIHERSPLNAGRWLNGIYDAIDSLERFPHRCAAALEAERSGLPLKQHLFKSHRIIFLIDENTRAVHILNVRHQSMRPMGETSGEG